MKLLLTWVLHATALMALAHLYSGVEVTGVGAAMAAALVMGSFNLIVRPALVVLTLPVTFFTLGLFMFGAAAGLLDGFWVRGFGSALLGSLIYSAFGVLIDAALERLFPPQPL